MATKRNTRSATATKRTAVNRSTSNRKKAAAPRSKISEDNFTDKILKSDIVGNIKDGGSAAISLLGTWYAKPIVKYVAGGVASALVARFAYRYYKSHPEIARFVKDNLDNVEEKLKEFREDFQEEGESADTLDAEAHH